MANLVWAPHTLHKDTLFALLRCEHDEENSSHILYLHDVTCAGPGACCQAVSRLINRWYIRKLVVLFVAPCYGAQPSGVATISEPTYTQRPNGYSRINDTAANWGTLKQAKLFCSFLREALANREARREHIASLSTELLEVVLDELAEADLLEEVGLPAVLRRDK